MEKIIVCIAKDEPNIKEWINHHLSIGFDRIVIYTNDWLYSTSIDNVFVIQWPGKAQQMNCYNHALRTQTFDWAAFIDCDEYIICPQGLDNFLADKNGSFVMPWKIYGNRESAGNTVMERFKNWDYDPMGHVKIMVHKFFGSYAFDNPHFISRLPTYTPHGSIHRGPFTKELPDRIWINHYYYQDEDYWNRKIARGRADTGTQRKEKWEDGNKFNTHYD